MEASSLQHALRQAIDEWQKAQRTDFRCAFRDALTDMIHVADNAGIDFDEALEWANEVYFEECQENEPGKA